MHGPRIAIIGGGISGNLVARLLACQYEVHLFEANDYVGGHSNTVDVDLAGESFRVDTGFMVFNARTYPNFCRLLQKLKVDAQDSEMSFSVRCERTGLEYQGSSLNGLFAQRQNLLRPQFYGMLRDILRFNREATEVLASDEPLSLGEYLSREGYGSQFVNQYLLPMSGAIWSCRPGRMLDFPARFLVSFFKNHGLLQVRDRPQWKTILGGAKEYVEKLTAPFQDRIRLNCPIQSVKRYDDHVVVKPKDGDEELFDQVVFAAHADQTLAMLADADATERQVLAAFPYQANDAVLHTDSLQLPRRRRAWASWNYYIPPDADAPVSVTYDLSRLQNHASSVPILLTLNNRSQLDPATVRDRFDYQHPAYSHDSIKAQQQHAQLNGHRRSFYCGAYWGNGFHEDGVNSAMTVAACFGIGWDAC